MLVFDRQNPTVLQDTLAKLRDAVAREDTIVLHGIDGFTWEHLVGLGLADKFRNPDDPDDVTYRYKGPGIVKDGDALVCKGVYSS